MSTRKFFSWRAFISLALSISLILLLVSSIVLFIAPPGRIANWSGWHVLGLDKAAWQHQHTIFGFAFVLLSLFHLIAFNWKAFLSYIRNRAAAGLSHPAELTATLLLTIILAVGTYLHLQPFESVIRLGETLSASWEEKASSPPVPHAESMSLEELALQPSVAQAPEALLDSLHKAGIRVESASQKVEDIAADNNMTANQLFRIMVPEPKAKSVPKEGFAKMLLSEVAEQAGVSSHALQLALEARGIRAENSESMREIAGKNRMEVPALRQAIEEILN